MSNSLAIDSEYPRVMKSITDRIVASSVAMDAMEKSPASPHNWAHLDFVTLQVRKICELILLGSSLAHLREGKSDIDPRKWRPKDAFAQLKKLSEHPLPIPLASQVSVHATGAKQLMPASKPMPFSVLSEIYGHCGDLLHVPSAEKVLEERITPFDWTRFRRWVDGFSRLVSGHVLMLPSLDKIVLCTWSGVATEEPNVYLLEGAGPSTFDLKSLPDFELIRP